MDGKDGGRINGRGVCTSKPDWGDQLGVRRAESKYGVVTAVISSKRIKIGVASPNSYPIAGIVGYEGEKDTELK